MSKTCVAVEPGKFCGVKLLGNVNVKPCFGAPWDPEIVLASLMPSACVELGSAGEMICWKVNVGPAIASVARLANASIRKVLADICIASSQSKWPWICKQITCQPQNGQDNQAH